MLISLWCGLVLTGCGGGGSKMASTSTPSPAPGPAPAPTAAALSVSCTPKVIAPGATSQCSATVSGTGSAAVNWSASGGTIDSSGLFTAPANAGTATVTATSTQVSSETAQATITVGFKTPPSKHVVLVMEENQGYATVAGNSTVWPNLNALMSQGAAPTQYYANVHSSIGNYFMLTTGETLTPDDSSTAVWDVDNLARRMLAAGVSFRIYAEGITQGYVGGDTGLYAIRHDPFAMLSDIANDAQVGNQVLCPFSQFAKDLANHALPEFSYIVPDLNDDAHNGTPQQADTWLQTNVVSPLSGDPAFQAKGDGVLIVDFDEADISDTTYGGGHVSPVLWGPIVQAGYTQTSTTIYQHQSMLRTIMEALGLPNPPGQAATAPSMAEFFVQ